MKSSKVSLKRKSASILKRAPAKGGSACPDRFHIRWAIWLDFRLVWYLRGLSWCTRGDANFKRQQFGIEADARNSSVGPQSDPAR
jgi:hypothetical protein